MVLSSRDLKELDSAGWVVVPSSAVHVLEVARSLGIPVPSRFGRGLVDVLVPVSQERAHPRSLSGIYGLGALPFHIDTAHWAVPCRYVLLSLAEAADTSTGTMLLNWSGLFTQAEQRRLAAAVLLVRNGHRSFYAPILDTQRGLLRCDPGCTVPASRDAQEVMTMVAERSGAGAASVHMWSKEDLLIVDNWRTLHSRPPTPNSSQRRLRRVLVSQ